MENIEFIYEYGKKIIEKILKRKLMRSEMFLDFYGNENEIETRYTYIPSNNINPGILIQNTNDVYIKTMEHNLTALKIKIVKFEIKNSIAIFIEFKNLMKIMSH